MTRLANLVLRHKLVVVLAWLAVTVAGFVTIGTTTSRLSANFALPGQAGYVTDAHIGALYHNGGGTPPTILTVALPAGAAANQPATAAAVARTFAAAAAAVPGTRLADAATTGDTHFATAGGRTAFALAFTAARFQGRWLPRRPHHRTAHQGPRRGSALRLAHRGHRVGPAGQRQAGLEGN